MTDKNILILTPSLENSGGVANYYRVLKDKLPFAHTFFIVGKRESGSDAASHMHPFRRLMTDYIAFVRALWGSNHNLVLINPSLNFNSFSRDYIFFLLAKLFRKKTIVFFRGWDDDYAQTVLKGKWRKLFRPIFNADALIVLSRCFRDTLLPHSRRPRIFVETTVFDERMLPPGDQPLYARKNPNGKIRMLFLSRVEADKGIYDAISAYQTLRNQNIPVELIIAGNGGEATRVQQLVEAEGDENLRYLGHIGGDAKAEALLSSSILLFPSTHPEGMPNTVLEAMGCGLAVLTTRIGGLNDFFDGTAMGAELTADFAEQIVDAVAQLHADPERLKSISAYNHDFAYRYFYSQKVVDRLDRITDAVLRSTGAAPEWYATEATKGIYTPLAT